MSSLAEQYNTVPTTLLQMSHEAAEGWSGIQWETPLYIVSCINIICCFLTSTPHYPSAIRWSPTRECFLLCSCSASFSCHLRWGRGLWWRGHASLRATSSWGCARGSPTAPTCARRRGSTEGFAVVPCSTASATAPRFAK